MVKSEVKTMKISELIKLLEIFKKDFGDMPVIHQEDPEGNGFGTLNCRSFYYDQTKMGNTLFIMPFEEGVEDRLFEW